MVDANVEQLVGANVGGDGSRAITIVEVDVDLVNVVVIGTGGRETLGRKGGNKDLRGK